LIHYISEKISQAARGELHKLYIGTVPPTVLPTDNGTGNHYLITADFVLILFKIIDQIKELLLFEFTETKARNPTSKISFLPSSGTPSVFSRLTSHVPLFLDRCKYQQCSSLCNNQVPSKIFFLREGGSTAQPHFHPHWRTACELLLSTKLRIRDVYPGSRNRIFSIPDPGSQRFPDDDDDRGCSSRIPDFLPIPDPGVNGSRIRMSGASDLFVPEQHRCCTS
jgi:hypothetical protein